MVSNVSLTKIHRRLSEVLIPHENVSFGGKNILLFGDLLQLKPVSASYCFEVLEDKELKFVFDGTVGKYSLWKEFQYRELEENMRQKENLEYAEMLNRIRIGSPLVEDIDKLKTRIVNVDGKLVDIGGAAKMFHEKFAHNAVCLLPTHAKVTLFNETMLKLKNISVVQIKASDFDSAGKTKLAGKKSTVKAILKKKASETGGLETILKIGVNARVMLRQNIDVARGLVNGALGTVLELIKIDSRINKIKVAFDHVTGPYEVEKMKVDFQISKDVYMERKQFPLCLAYSMTIHKSQISLS
jgi:ATP-dependent exoDNAse (exonuclease V) alpha subunit